MRTPAGTECPYFYGDYFRGRNVEECRLLKAEGEQWTRDLCKTCPVPGIARANSCEFMKLTPTVARPIEALFQRRVKVSAYCEKTKPCEVAINVHRHFRRHGNVRGGFFANLL